MPIIRNYQKGVIQPMVIIGALLLIGAVLVIANFNKISPVNIPISSNDNQKGTGSWLYKVDLNSCQAIVDRANLNSELQVVKDPQATWQHRCSLSPTESAAQNFGLSEFVIDAIYDENGVIDPVGNAVKFKTKEPIVDFVASKYIGQNYQDIYQEPDAISSDFITFKSSLEQGYSKIDKIGTFPTTQGQGAYLIIANYQGDFTIQDYSAFSHAKKGSCNIVLSTDPTKNRASLETQLVEMVQKIDSAINTECGKPKS
ncbi:MAG TPA: hypothetical protein VJG66_00930 [Patescibacteria group bacterium]|nr:hypothetical protein [Patescibacteria group bacterium]